MPGTRPAKGSRQSETQDQFSAVLGTKRGTGRPARQLSDAEEDAVWRAGLTAPEVLQRCLHPALAGSGAVVDRSEEQRVARRHWWGRAEKEPEKVGRELLKLLEGLPELKVDDWDQDARDAINAAVARALVAADNGQTDIEDEVRLAARVGFIIGGLSVSQGPATAERLTTLLQEAAGLSRGDVTTLVAEEAGQRTNDYKPYSADEKSEARTVALEIIRSDAKLSAAWDPLSAVVSARLGAVAEAQKLDGADRQRLEDAVVGQALSILLRDLVNIEYQGPLRSDWGVIRPDP